jgi:FtsH-binding integral membrane protein
MTQNTFVERMKDQQEEDYGAGRSQNPGRRTVTFMGNTYDLAALGALASGVLVLLSCVTCNMSFYCLPFIPLLLGLVGIFSAREAVDEERTKLWSWFGAGAGVVVLMGLILVMIISCVAFALLMANAETY